MATGPNVWFGRGLTAAVVVALGIGALWRGPALWAMLQDQAALEAWVAGLGWLGPLALVAINAVQIVFAPLPGYVMQLAAGYLFGPIWGGIWASLGLLIGGSLAFWLARIYGRPVAARLVGGERLDRWESVTYSSSLIVWFILILAPTGDAPFFLAGLARVAYWRILLLTLLIRVPSTFVVAAAGAGIMILSWQQLAWLFAALFAMLALFLRYQAAIVHWVDNRVRRRVHPHTQPLDTPLPHDGPG
jgi:uncharacterized membrane protein YdjX (TVP38/TMEM64 family)